MKTRLSEDDTKLVATFELSPFHFDRTGVLTPCILSHMINLPGAEKSEFFRIPGYSETVTSFLRYQEFNLQPAYYTDVGTNSTVEVVAEIGHVGKSSYVFKGDVRRLGTDSKNSICVFNTQLVHVDMSSRQPIALPQHLRQKGKGPRPTFDLPMSPSTPMYSHAFSIVESDIDFNGHTNQSVFIRLCTDTAALGMKAGCYPSLSGDVLKYRVKKIAMLYQEESHVGDMLDVQSWEITSKPVSLGFQVKREEEDIVRCLFEFSEQKSAKL